MQLAPSQFVMDLKVRLTPAYEVAQSVLMCVQRGLGEFVCSVCEGWIERGLRLLDSRLIDSGLLMSEPHDDREPPITIRPTERPNDLIG